MIIRGARLFALEDGVVVVVDEIGKFDGDMRWQSSFT
jgi:hypothetical protein